ncbi:MAG: hydrolase [Proteobacteria bacterium]|nr:hydrolase [Pseudomonadota bacterium]
MSVSTNLTSFKPAWWLPGPHLPTLWAALASPRPPTAATLERIELDDGDFIDLHWVGTDNGPLVVVLHGLEGSANSTYAARILHRISANDWGGALLHFRGCSGEPNRADRSYHSGETDDLRFLLSLLKLRYPTRPIFAVGYSLGGNVLLKYLGESGRNSDIAVAAAISVPFDLAAGANRLNTGLSRLYQRHLVLSLQGKIRRKFANRAAPIAIEKLDEWSDFWSFDHQVTAPLHNFASAHDYYSKSSCRQFLPSIAAQTLIIHSRDDPFLSIDAIPNAVELSATTRMIVTKTGGHVGFVAGSNPFKPRFWSDDQIVAWFEYHTEKIRDLEQSSH